MKKIGALLFLLSSLAYATEIFPETYTMKKFIPELEKAKVYEGNSKYEATQKVRAMVLNSKLTKALGSKDSTIYFVNFDGEVTKARVGDYIVAPTTLGRLYALPKAEFEAQYRGN